MKIGFQCSSFDLFHAGHVTMLKMERELCDYLKVAIQVDPTIDKTQTFHIRFLSEEYKDVDVTGKQYCIDHGIEIHYHLRRHTYSSTEIRNRVYELEKIKKDEKIDEKIINQYSPELLKKYKK